MFKTKISLMLLAIVAVLTLCSFATQAQTSVESQRQHYVDSLITDSATGADAIKFINIVSEGPGKGDIAPWIIAVLLAGIAVYKHFRSISHKKTAEKAKANSEFYYNELGRINKPTVMNTEDEPWIESDALKYADRKSDNSNAMPFDRDKAVYAAKNAAYADKKKAAGNPNQPRKGGKFVKKTDFDAGNKDTGV